MQHLIALTCPAGEGPGADVAARIEAEYTDAYKLAEGVYLTRGRDAPEQVSARIGLTEPEPEPGGGATGVVLQLGEAYSGREEAALRDWLRAAQ